MNCFEHPQKPAVGTCTNCGRGLCKECTTIIEGKLSCRGACQQEVARERRILAGSELTLNQRSVVYEASAKTYQRSFAFSAIFGLMFVLGGALLVLNHDDIPGAVMLVLGAVFLMHGIGMARAGKKFKALAKEGSDSSTPGKALESASTNSN